MAHALQNGVEGDLQAIIERLVAQAKAGDIDAIALIFKHILPKERLVTLSLPPLKSAADAPGAVAAIVRAVAHGAITPAEGERLAGLIDRWARTVEFHEIREMVDQVAERVAALEEK